MALAKRLSSLFMKPKKQQLTMLDSIDWGKNKTISVKKKGKVFSDLAPGENAANQLTSEMIEERDEVYETSQSDTHSNDPKRPTIDAAAGGLRDGDDLMRDSTKSNPALDVENMDEKRQSTQPVSEKLSLDHEDHCVSH